MINELLALALRRVSDIHGAFGKFYLSLTYDNQLCKRSGRAYKNSL